MALCGSFVFAIMITWVSIPTIVRISKFKRFFDTPNERTSHFDDTPNLGGLSVFAGFSLSVIIFSFQSESAVIKYLLGGLIVLFFIGLKDDILIIDPKKKVLGQVIASLLIVWMGDIRLTNFHHVLGIGEIPALVSVLFTLFLFIVLVNGFNLIDGIDGLASAVGFFVAVLYSIWFILTNHFTYGVLSVSLAGSLLAFFRFNVFSTRNKIFLGDTGSMLTGFVVSVLTVQFLEFELNAPLKYQFDSAPALTIGLLIIPLFDTLRVFVLRLSNGKSPFKADRNHLHHGLLNLGLSHLEVTIIMISFNLLIFIMVILLQGLGDVLLIILITLLGVLFSFLPWILKRYRANGTKVSK
jgi:UDP-N-acetylmuramyl pentapeptide phosphotransferase/UDP-N-acetylglucosamine-1-phosphate transferase